MFEFFLSRAALVDTFFSHRSEKSRSEDTSREGNESDTEHGSDHADDFATDRYRHDISISDRRDRHNGPIQTVKKGIDIRVDCRLEMIDQDGTDQDDLKCQNSSDKQLIPHLSHHFKQDSDDLALSVDFEDI